MTIILGSYTYFERKLLVAAYYSLNQVEDDSVVVRDVTARYFFDDKPKWFLSALSHFIEKGWSTEQLVHGNIDEQRIELSAEGLREAERLIEADAVKLELKEGGPQRIDSSAWTGLPSKFELTAQRREALQRAVAIAEADLSSLGADNETIAQARAYIVAIRALSDAPRRGSSPRRSRCSPARR